MSWWVWMLISLAVVAAVWAAFVVRLMAVGRRGDARALATFSSRRSATRPSALGFVGPDDMHESDESLLEEPQAA